MYAQQVQPGYAGLRAEINALSAAGPTCKHRDTKSAVAQLVDALRLFVPNETAFEHLNSCRNNYSQGYGDFLRNGVASVARQIHDNRKIDAATIDNWRKHLGFEAREGYDRASQAPPHILSLSDYHSLGVAHAHPYCNMSLRQAAYYPHTSAEELRQRWWS